METFLSSLRICVATLLVCAGGYTACVLGLAQLATPYAANGSLVVAADGRVIGSALIAQAFTKPGYFWPRPSAVGYNAAGAGGSNKSPTSSDLTDRAQKTVAEHGATAGRPLPPDLAAASGSGLDPHVTERAARWQVARVAAARGLPPDQVAALIDRFAFGPGGVLTSERIVSVLDLNLALDRL
jgi:K+-transporting ATPase ATPase C chain